MTVAVNDINRETTAQRAPGAKIRILATANELFYGDGIRSVGIDRLISSSSVTKATFYKHYGSKDRLILQYIEGRHDAEVAQLETIAAKDSNPESALRAIVSAVETAIGDPGFRGDAFLNAATEFAEPTHPVRAVVLRHREWLTGFLADLFQSLGHRRPGDAADEFLLARDGAMAGGYAGDPIAAVAAFSRTADRVITAAAA